MSRHAKKIECSEEEIRILKSITNSRSSELRQVERCKIILECTKGKENQQIANELGFSIPTVIKWRNRFANKGMDGLIDAPRTGAPAKYDKTFRDKVISLIERMPPEGQVNWDCQSVAERLGSSMHAVWRTLRKEGIYLQRLRTWCISTDPEFATKAADIIGLYLNPPENALVLSVDEKPSMQALERTVGYVKTNNAKIVRALKSTYKRHGTLNLFAALNVATGHVHAKTTDSKKREDFQSFLKEVLDDLPKRLEIHVVLDNYCTHKKNDDWLKQYEGRVQFHFTPTSASWLNQVEILFGILSRKTLRGASFKSKEDLRCSIEAFIKKHNKNAEPFKWRKREVRGSQLRNTLTNLCK